MNCGVLRETPALEQTKKHQGIAGREVTEPPLRRSGEIAPGRLPDPGRATGAGRCQPARLEVTSCVQALPGFAYLFAIAIAMVGWSWLLLHSLAWAFDF
jgi:hypothetical protein